MTVLLRQSRHLSPTDQWDSWVAVTGTPGGLDPSRCLPGLAERLERAFEAERNTWWAIGRDLGRQSSAEIAHMPTAGSFGSDFGIMLAWSRLVTEAVESGERLLVICDDPWVFRHLAGLSGVDGSAAPGLAFRRLKGALRGFLARTRVALRVARAAKSLPATDQSGRAVLLVYGHPSSNTEGFDAYFGDLMRQFPKIGRALHTDCPLRRARELGADGRTVSLHAWGSLWFALTLPLVTWAPRIEGPLRWLVQRSADLENSGGGPAMNRWQMHCQNRWLRRAKPKRVLWPWENHGWERNLCRAARPAGVPTYGYQHTVIGPHQFNYSSATNWDRGISLPDLIIADGPAYRDEMVAWNIPEDRLVIGGSLRLPRYGSIPVDPQGPVFVPLSAIPAAAEQQVAAARLLAQAGHRVLVKEHPMYPLAFETQDGLARTDESLAQQKGLSAVLFSTGASGLEAVLMGIPAIRLQLPDRIAINVLPAGVTAPTATLDTVVERFKGQLDPPRVAWDSVLADPDSSLWHRLLIDDIHSDTPETPKKTAL
ncbi:hypothetical protein [Magnetospira sp. QH-2]|uniref:hypothetical protein n=1 Tax=Magnetospira sp. (strain QH-2) TaxID=1288970 RepID=UPI0003E80FFC|nr:hypothetical protein [Magnetospira sp. QH-2]CCQ75482.1 conserved protein of unknown function [Magnetospira sp. QH-2]